MLAITGEKATEILNKVPIFRPYLLPLRCSMASSSKANSYTRSLANNLTHDIINRHTDLGVY